MRKLLFHIILILTLASCQDKIVDIEQVLVPEISLIVPSNYITAGKNISVQLVNEQNYQGEAVIYWSSALSNYKKSFRIEETYPEVLIRGSQLQDAGLVTFTLLVNNQIVDAKELLVKAADVVDPIEIFTGPNTVWVNNKQPSMVVALPKDKYHNAGREGDSIRFEMRFPDESESDEFVSIKNQLVYRKMQSKNKAGKIFTGISDTKASAKEQRVDVIQLWPRAIEIEIINYIPYADNRQFCEIQSSKLMDENGEIIPDGMLVKYEVRSGKRKAVYNSYSIDGEATVYLKNPAFPSLWKVKAYVGNSAIESNELILKFNDNIKDVPIDLKYEEIVVGPITSYIGQYIPDGTLIYFFNGENILKEESEDGYVRFSRPRELVNAKIRVAGKTIELEDEE